MRAVLYLRYSSDKQTEQSIEGQRNICMQYCERKGIEVVNEYVDRAASASKNIERRTDFLRMISDSAHKTFDAVVVYKFDRFARNSYEDAIYRHKLEENGVKLLSASENIPEDASGIILQSVITGINQYYSAELAEKVKRGMDESAKKCNSTGGTIPFGYDTIDKKYVINEEEAAVVLEVFKRYVSGERPSDIAASLTSRGIRNVKGSPFTVNTIAKMISNKKYCGYYVYNGYEVKDGIPAIVDETLWTSANVKLKSRKINNKASGGTRVERGLAGKVYCTVCRRFMKGTSTTKPNGKRYYYYRCVNGCIPLVDRKLVEDAVFNDILQTFSPERIRELATEVSAERRKLVEEKYNVSVLEAELEELNKKYARALKVYLEMGKDDIVTKMYEQVKDQKTALEQKLDSIHASSYVDEKNEIVAFLDAIMSDKDNPKIRQKIFDEFVIDVEYAPGALCYMTRIDKTTDNILHPVVLPESLPESESGGAVWFMDKLVFAKTIKLAK